MTHLELGSGISENVVQELATQTSDELKTFTYFSGPFCGNFVSTHRSSWKITIFCKDQENMEAIMSRILKILGEFFDLNCFSFTTFRKKVHLHSRTCSTLVRLFNHFLGQKALWHVLRKVVLFCNDLSSPIVLYQYTLRTD